MGKSRYDIDRATKLAQILDEAERQLTASGYDGLSIAGVARAVGIAPNSVSWYFPSKDRLLVGVLRRALEQQAPDFPKQLAALELVDALLVAADRIQAYRQLAVALHQRLEISRDAAAFHDDLHRVGQELLISALRSRVREQDVDIVASLLLTVVEGQLLHPIPDAERHRQIRALIDAFTRR
jgi:AcrR family transcriptional regulator